MSLVGSLLGKTVGKVIPGLGIASNAYDLFNPKALADDSVHYNGPSPFADPNVNRAAPQPAAAAAPGGANAAVGGYSTGGGGTLDANTYGPNVNAARGSALDAYHTLMGLYDALNAQLGTYGADKRGQLDSAHNDVLTQNSKEYGNAVDGTNSAFVGRNAFDSSFRGNANQANFDAFGKSNKAENDSYGGNLAALGSTLAQYAQQFSNRPQFDANAYNTVGDLNSAQNNFKSGADSLRKDQYNIFTNGQLQGELNKIAPGTSDLGAQLKSRLDALVQSNAAPEAKFGIAKTYISSLPAGEQDYWNNYWQQLMAPKPAAAAPQAA